MMVCVVVGWLGFAGCGDNNGDPGTGRPAPGLVSIAIAPNPATVDVGNTVQMVATGTFDVGSPMDVTTQATWTSSDATIATVSATGGVSGVAAGSATITATIGTISASATVNVNAVVATIASIAVTPANPTLAPGATQQMTATATFTDGTTQDVSATANWSTDNAATAGVNATGLVTAAAAGSAKITAAVGAVSGSTTVTVQIAAPVLVSISVTPINPALKVGNTQQLTATGTLSDNSTVDLTATATWTSSDAAIASVNATGLVTANAKGAATITATSAGVSGATTVTVDINPPVLLSITVGPVPASAPAGLTQQLTATGTFDIGPPQDITNMVTWSSASAAIASVDANTGLVTAHTVGIVDITATLGAISGKISFSVTDAVAVGLVVLPRTFTLRGTENHTFTLFTLFSDGKTVAVLPAPQWSSSNPAVASVSMFGGVVTGHTAGTATITATTDPQSTDPNKSASATVTVDAASVLAASPANGALNARATSHIKIAFDQAVTPASITTQTAAGPCTGSLQVSGDDFQTCIGFTAASPVLNAGATSADATPISLTPGAAYKIKVTGFTAADGSPGKDFVQTTGFTVADAGCASGLVISQVFGGGASGTKSPYRNDFVELHNGSATAIALKDFSIQFAAAGGVTWTSQDLPDVVLAPGGYFLIQENSGTAVGGAPLPMPDFAPNAPFQLSSTAGKVALVQGHAALAGACPVADSVDFVGYGDTTGCGETAPTAAASNVTGAVRNTEGCTDSENNSTDFTVGTPATPRNTATAANVCACSTH